MKIEEVRFHKNTADVTAGGVVYEKLPLSEVIYYAVDKDKEMEEEEFQQFLVSCDRTAAKDYLFAMLSRGAKTEMEARIRLCQKGYRYESITNALALAKQYGYISDSAFAETYVEINKASKGGYRIRSELKCRGVPDEIISQATAGIKETEKDSAARMAQKLAAGKDLADRKTKERLFRQLASRGFSYDAIKKAISELGADVADFEEDI
jgi:SOS response regulatory protein OraA/RecX